MPFQLPPESPTGTSALRMLLLSRALVGVEDLPATRHLDQKIRRLEASGEASVEILEPLHHDVDPQRIHVPERTAAERRESNSKNRPDVAIARGPDDSVTQTARGLVEHRQDRPLLYLHGRHLRNHVRFRR